MHRSIFVVLGPIIDLYHVLYLPLTTSYLFCPRMSCRPSVSGNPCSSLHDLPNNAQERYRDCRKLSTHPDSKPIETRSSRSVVIAGLCCLVVSWKCCPSSPTSSTRVILGRGPKPPRGFSLEETSYAHWCLLRRTTLTSDRNIGATIRPAVV